MLSEALLISDPIIFFLIGSVSVGYIVLDPMTLHRRLFANHSRLMSVVIKVFWKKFEQERQQQNRNRESPEPYKSPDSSSYRSPEQVCTEKG